MSAWQKPNTLPHPKKAGLFWGAIRVSTLGGPLEWQIHMLCLDDETHDVHPNYYCGWRWADYELWMPCTVPAAPDQPQAREDAQPVAWRSRLLDAFGDGAWAVTTYKPSADEVEPLYTHPAPDALREAYVALKEVEDALIAGSNGWRLSPDYSIGSLGRALTALAALQAEQKGGA